MLSSRKSKCKYNVPAAILALVLLAPASASAQTFQQDLALLIEQQPALKNTETPTRFEVERVSEAKTVVLAAIFLYQSTLSSQDTHRCNFTPSCSHFGAEALERAGPVQGALLTSDRLMRCNGLPDIARHYLFDPNTGRFIDPVETYLDRPLAAHETANVP